MFTYVGRESLDFLDPGLRVVAGLEVGGQGRGGGHRGRRGHRKKSSQFARGFNSDVHVFPWLLMALALILDTRDTMFSLVLTLEEHTRHTLPLS